MQGSGTEKLWAPDLEPLFDAMFEGVQVVDFGARYLYLNLAAADHGRRPAKDLVGQRMADMYPGIDQTEFYALLQRCLSKRESQKMLNHFTYPDGSQGWFDLRISPVPMGALILSIDISGRMDLENKVRDSERLESIGRLAGGVAHDFNNNLNVILGYADLLARSLDPADPRTQDLAEIIRASERGAKLTRQLMAFGRKQVLQPQVVDINQVLEGLGAMFKRVLGADINLALLPRRPLDQVLVDPGQLEQVLMNLVLNARDAMVLGGKLTLETANVALDPDYAVMHPGTKAGPHVMLAVTDTGIGMDIQTQSRVFEPFFSTKEAGKGTGLGLATVHGIVKQSGGHIWVYSEPGRGTCFKVYFPSQGRGSEVLAPAPSRPVAVVRGNAKLLLVEDEDALRALLERVLSGAGYQVKAVQSAEAALEFLQSQDWDLLLSDVVLPGMNGRELVLRARELKPGLKMALMSGYTDNAILHQGVLEADMAFIEKPVSADVLLDRVARILLLG